jgi:hypothetical protein
MPRAVAAKVRETAVMRRLLCTFVIACAGTGCAGQQQPITERDTTNIALYCSGMLHRAADLGWRNGVTPDVVGTLRTGANSLNDTGRYGATRVGMSQQQVEDKILAGWQALPTVTDMRSNQNLSTCAKVADISLGN